LVKFIQTSDWQIGMKAGGLGEAGSLIREERIGSISTIFEIAQENEADFVLICGDVFEHNMISSEDVLKVVSIFNSYPDMPIYLLPGNHDALGPGSVYERNIFSRIPNLTIFKKYEPLNIDSVTFHPLPIKSYYQKEAQTRNLQCVIELEGIHIGVAHGSLIGAFYVSDEDLDYPIDPTCIEKSGIDYLALGHWHSHRQFKDGNGITRIAYSGTHEQTKYAEDSAGHCLLVEIEGKGETPRIKPIKCGKLTWNSIDFELRDVASISELSTQLDSAKDFDMLELNLTGEISIEDRLEIENLLEYHKTQHSHFRVKIDNFQYIATVSLDKVKDLGDPILNQTDKCLRDTLQVETNSGNRAVIVEALSLLQRLVSEVSQ